MPIKIITDGMVFHYDANSKRSFVGAPTSNLYFTPTPDSSGNVGFAVNGTGTFKRVLSGNYGGYDIQATDVVYRYDLGGLGCHYHGNDYNVPSGYYLTFAFDYYVSPGAGSYPVINYLGNVENGGNGISMAIGDYDSTTGVWKRAVMSSGNTSNGSGFSRFLLYPGACGDGVSCCRLATSGYILYKNPQAEMRSFSTSYIPTGASSTGSRSVTSSLFDMSGNTDINLTNAAYDSSGALTFGGSNYLSLSKTAAQLNLGTGAPMSVGAWVYITSLSGYTHIVDGSGNRWHLAVESSGDGASAYFWNGSSYHSTSSPAITANTWTYIVGVQEASLLKLYINGVLATNGSISSASSNLIQDCNIVMGYWQSGGGRYMNGKINQVSIYNRALTADEVLNNYNASKGRFGLL